MLAIGTGSVFGAQRRGRVKFVGGWGFRLGDQASGAVMGHALLVKALLAHDGLLPAETLLRDVVAEAGGPAGLVAQMAEAPPSDYARYMPRILEAAARGETAASAILSDADRILGKAVDLLGTGGPDLPVCFLGGMGGVFAQRLQPLLGGRITPPVGSALDGALALARDMV